MQEPSLCTPGLASAGGVRVFERRDRWSAGRPRQQIQTYACRRAGSCASHLRQDSSVPRADQRPDGCRMDTRLRARRLPTVEADRVTCRCRLGLNLVQMDRPHDGSGSRKPRRPVTRRLYRHPQLHRSAFKILWGIPARIAIRKAQSQRRMRTDWRITPPALREAASAFRCSRSPHRGRTP